MIRKKRQHLFFEVGLSWQPGGETMFHCNNVTNEQMFEPVSLKTADATYWHPEHLLLAAFTGNYLETLRSFLQKSGLLISRFSSNIIAQVEVTPKNSYLVNIHFYPNIGVEDLTLTGKYKDLVNALQRECLIEHILQVPVFHHTVLNNGDITHPTT